MANDVMKILKDLELKAVGLDEQTKKQQEGYFVSFRSIGLPVRKEDYANPWSPLGSNLQKDLPPELAGSTGTDPQNAPKTASAQLDEDRIFTANIAKSQQSYLNTFLLTDDKLQMNSDYSVIPSSSKVSDSWYAIITGANGIPPKSELSEEMKAAYEKAAAKLMDKDGNATPKYEAYLRYQDEYKSKVRAWTRAYASAFTDPMRLQNWPIEGKLYHEEADEALDRWTGLGHKQEIETAVATLAAQGIDPAIALIVRSKKRFINSLTEFQNVGQIPYTILSPQSWYDADNDDGWNIYSKRDFHHESHYTASSSSVSVGGGINMGFWKANASFNKADQRSDLQVQTNNLEINFKYAIVDVKRPWLDTSLLNLKNWFLMGDYKKHCISNGTMGQHLPPGLLEPTFLPSVVTSLILVKDVSIKWDDWKSQWQSASSSMSTGASVGFGPFAVSGKYERRNEQRDFVCDSDGEALRIPGIQLVGYVSAINPACPAVDSSAYLSAPGG